MITKIIAHRKRRHKQPMQACKEGLNKTMLELDSCIIISENSFIFVDESNYFRHYLTLSASCFGETQKKPIFSKFQYFMPNLKENNSTKFDNYENKYFSWEQICAS